ncbi:hypothetical protein OAK24_01340 [Flavobacteriales bacterium]|nr:hypothetical protein [Flavobacteriales bacterium]
MKNLILLFMLFLFIFPAQAQTTISSIIVNGNSRTKKSIILRELSFEENKSYSRDDLVKRIKEGKESLVNLKLFNFVEINKIEENNKAEVTIEVIEKWYVWPYPIFEISERNFNTWWQEFKATNYADFSRLNYGIFFNWENFRGRNELLKLKIRKGFKEQYLLAYQAPYLNKNKTLGLNTRLQFFRRKKTFYKTVKNDLMYYENKNNDTYTSEDYEINFNLLYRKGIHKKHTLKFYYFNSVVSDSITILNSNYLNNNQSSGAYFKTTYQFTNEQRDYTIYPLHGYLLDFELSKYFQKTIPVNHFELKARGEKHIELKKKLFLGSSFAIKLSSEDNQPYLIQRGFGFKDYVRGYEYYVVDGQQFWLSKTAIKYALVEKTIFEIPYVKMRQFKKSHYSIYLGIFSDMGYIYDLPHSTTNPLQSRLLWGKGFSLDYITYYDQLLRIEYSVNQLGEKGVFLHFSNPFG